MNLRKNSSFYLLPIIVLFVLVPFQNCSPGFKANLNEFSEQSQSSTSNDDTANPDTGSNDNDDAPDIPTIPPPAVNKDLLTVANMKYRGAFRISVTNDDLGVNYSYGQIAYNSDNKSLFVVGHDYTQNIGEFVIPQLSTSTDMSQLPLVTIAKDKLKHVLKASGVNNSTNVDRITGMLYKNNQLIVNAEIWYDGGGTNSLTTLVVKDVKNFASSAVYGFYQMGGAAQAAGYMSEVPTEWRQKVGSTHITGWSTVSSIISRYSIGPSIFSFDVDALLRLTTKTGTIPTKAIMNFPYGGNEYLSPTATSLDTNRQPASAVYNSLSKGLYGFIVPGTSTFAVFGSTEGLIGGLGYKITQDDGNVCGGPCPYIATDTYNYYWFFDMNEILSAPRVSAPRPYAYGKLSVPFDQNGHYKIGGGAYDSQSGLIYFSLIGADRLTGAQTPLIVSFAIEK